MLFNSLAYVVFLPIVLLGFFAIPPRFRWLWLLGASYIFYASWSARYLLLFVANTCVAYLAGLGFGVFSQKLVRRLILAGTVGLLLGTLFVFKYFDFACRSLEALFALLAIPVRLPRAMLTLPVGVSFYTFQALAYVIDVYNRRVEPERHPGLFALYKAFFPQLVAGPIERPARLLPQLHAPTRLEFRRLATGFSLILFGLFKKVVIADRLALYVNEVYGHAGSYRGLPVILATYLFAFQIYCDFSGYSDIAIGSARLFGYDLMQNFDRPYFSRSVREFWTRWHISLSSWFRDYLYVPLGGNRVPAWRNRLNILIVFLVSGLWHGAAWTFVAWGALHGFYLLFAIWTQRPRTWLTQKLGLARVPRLHAWGERLVVFHLVTFAWVFFRADSFGNARIILHQMSDLELSLQALVVRSMNAYELLLGVLGIVLMTSLHAWQRGANTGDFLATLAAPVRWALLYGFALSIALFGEFNMTEFIYFRF